MEGEGKTGSGATAKRMAVVLKLRIVLNLVPRVFPLCFPEDPGYEVGSVPCLRVAVSTGIVTPTAIQGLPVPMMAETFSRQ